MWPGVSQIDWQNKGLSGAASSYSPKDQFHLIHVAGKDAGRAKCSDCHSAGFDSENIRTGLRESCANCHTVDYQVASSNGAIAGCTGCHAQHGEQKEMRASIRQDHSAQPNAEPPPAQK
jgi:hypothetical protein